MAKSATALASGRTQEAHLGTRVGEAEGDQGDTRPTCLPDSARVLYGPERVAERVTGIAKRISGHYSGDEPLLVIALLKGSFIFVSDLVRAMDIPVEIDFMVVSSYGESDRSSGDVQILHDVRTSLRHRHVLIVEDIIDTGATLKRLLPQLRARAPASLEVCTLLHKRSKSSAHIDVRWVCFEAPSDFLVGYGLDFAEAYRQLPLIAAL